MAFAYAVLALGVIGQLEPELFADIPASAETDFLPLTKDSP